MAILKLQTLNKGVDMNQDLKDKLNKNVEDYVDRLTNDCSSSEYDELEQNALSDLESDFDNIDEKRYMCEARPDNLVPWLIEKQYIINNLI